MKKYRVWLSYDLGVSGDYDGLYVWLDNHEAVECGNSVASFIIEIANKLDPHDYMKDTLTRTLELKASNKLYCICSASDFPTRGKFIYGGRRASPWQGYGNHGTDEEESSES